MQVGLSVYSLFGAIHRKEMNVLDAVRLAAEWGADCVELVDFVLPAEDADFSAALGDVLKATGLTVSSYCTGINVLGVTAAERAAAMAKVKAKIDFAHSVGTKVFRSDLAGGRNAAECGAVAFDADLPALVEAAQELADYAKPRGITITAENHGIYVNGADRLQRLVAMTDRDNYGCTLDVGNCLCVDEDAYAFTNTLLPCAKAVHFKDFLVRQATGDAARDPAGRANWLTTRGGNFLRGTIVGDGDIETAAVMGLLKQANFNGPVIVEFEGPEACVAGAKASLAYVKTIAGA